MDTKSFKTALTSLLSLSFSSIFILLIVHLIILNNNWLSNIFNNGYGIFHGWKCGNTSGGLILTFSIIGGLCLYIPSTMFCILDYYLEKNNTLQKYKVSLPDKQQLTISWDKYITAINLIKINSSLSFFIIPFIILPIMELRGNCDKFSMLHDYDEVTYTDILFYLLKIASVSYVSGALFYCSHRLMHEIKWCYQNIHKIHHQFNDTFGIAASASHPLEHIFVNLLTVFGAPIILKMNCLSVFIWLWIASLGTTYGHSGYDTFDMFRWRISIGTPHDYHHLLINCEYGPGFNTFMDTIFKTRIQDIYPKRWKQILSMVNKQM